MVTFEVPSSGSSVDAAIGDTQVEDNRSRSKDSLLTSRRRYSTSQSGIIAFLAYHLHLPEQLKNRPWRLELPIHGTIARRRALGREEDPADIAREQESRSQHEHACKFGPLADVNTSFREVDWIALSKHQSRMSSINGGEPVSPKTVTRVE